jgi:proteic killer suppression protein
MIISFRHKGLEKFYKTGSKVGIQAKHAAKQRKILGVLDVVTKADDVELVDYLDYH